jgi:hypothetical protein
MRMAYSVHGMQARVAAALFVPPVNRSESNR